MFKFNLSMAIILGLAVAGCASTPPTPEPEVHSYGVIIGEAWDLKIDLEPMGFFEAIGAKGEQAGEVGAKGGVITGCVTIGILALPAVQAGCAIGALVLVGPSYVLGYGIGVIAGTIEGTVNAAANVIKAKPSEREEPIDTAPLIAVFKKSGPVAALKLALDGLAQKNIETPKYTFVTESFAVEDQPLAALHGAPKRIKLKDEDARKIGDAGNSRILVLLIHRFDVTTTGSAKPVSRLNILVSGELRSPKDNKRVKSWVWKYHSAPVKPREIVADHAKLLRLEITRGWKFIAEKVISDALG